MLTRKTVVVIGLGMTTALFGAVTNGCVSEAPCECIRSHGKTDMTSADIQRLIDVGIKECFDHSEPESLSDDGRCLPTNVGTDARNGKSISVGYSCSDVCPDAGHISVIYDGVTEEECCGVGGIPAKDPAWGGFAGCVPPEVPWSTTDGCPGS